MLLIGGALAAISLIVLIAELFRPQRLKGSRGILGLYSAVLLLIAAFAVPFMGAYVAVQAVAVPTAVAAAPTNPAANAEIGATAETSASTPEPQSDGQTAQLFKAISAVVVDEIDVDPGIVTDALQNGTPLAQIVTENGGSVDHVIDAITEIMRASVRELAARGEINAFQAALALSQMPNLIRLAVNSDLNAFAARLSGATPDPNMTPTALFAFATADSATSAAPVPTATHQPKRQSSPTASPTHTSPPPSASPTPTPSATRFHYSTRTPTPTFTAVTPCLASVEYNLRLRSAPETDSETLAVIDYGTTVELYGKGGVSAGEPLVVRPLRRSGRLARRSVHAGRQRLRLTALAVTPAKGAPLQTSKSIVGAHLCLRPLLGRHRQPQVARRPLPCGKAVTERTTVRSTRSDAG